MCEPGSTDHDKPTIEKTFVSAGKPIKKITTKVATRQVDMA